MNLLLLLLSINIFIAFTLFVGTKYGVQKSISASIHVLDGMLEKSLYSWFILGIAIPMMIVSNTTLGWWAGAFLSLDFVATAVGEKKQIFIHCLGADVGMILGMLMLWIDFHLWYLPIACILFALLALWKLKNSVWWIETAVFVTVIIGLFIVKIL